MVMWALPTDLSENKFGKVDVIKTSLFLLKYYFLFQILNLRCCVIHANQLR